LIGCQFIFEPSFVFDIIKDPNEGFGIFLKKFAMPASNPIALGFRKDDITGVRAPRTAR
jgi:hypothetical protein